MNKYELALVVSAKVEDEVRDAVVEKAKGYITKKQYALNNKKLPGQNSPGHFFSAFSIKKDMEKKEKLCYHR